LDLHETAIIFAQDTRLLRGINCDVVYVDKDSFTNDEDGIVDTVVALAFANRKIFMINRTVGGEGDETKYELSLLNPYSETALEQ
jgi:signal peptidase I